MGLWKRVCISSVGSFVLTVGLLRLKRETWFELVPESMEIFPFPLLVLFAASIFVALTYRVRKKPIWIQSARFVTILIVTFIVSVVLSLGVSFAWGKWKRREAWRSWIASAQSSGLEEKRDACVRYGRGFEPRCFERSNELFESI